MIKKFQILVLFIFLIYLNGCKNDDIFPEISFSEKNYIAYSSDKINCSVIITSEKEINRLKISPTIKGLNENSQIDTILQDNYFSYDYEYVVQNYTNEEIINITPIIIYFEVFIRNGNSLKDSIIINLQGSYIENYLERFNCQLYSIYTVENKNTFLGFTNFFTNNTINYFTNLNSNNNSELIDFCYFYNNSEGAVIASPSDDLIINFENGSQNWETRNNTLFKKIEITTSEFENIDNTDKLEEYLLNVSDTKITNLKANDVFVFENIYNTKGIVLISSAENDSVGKINFEVKSRNFGAGKNKN